MMDETEQDSRVVTRHVVEDFTLMCFVQGFSSPFK